MRTQKKLTLAALMSGILALGACAPTLRTDGPIAVDFMAESYAQAITAMTDYPTLTQSGGLRPGDLVRIAVAQTPDLTVETRVLPNGQVMLPYIGGMVVAGRPVSDVQNEIEERYAATLHDPVVTISVLEFGNAMPQPKVYLMGNVRQPGAYIFDEPITVLEALAMGGGTDFGSDLNAIVTLRRDQGMMVATIYRAGDLLHRGAAKGTVSYLMPQDIIYVPRSGLTRVADVMEEVRRLVGLNGLSTNLSFRYNDED